MQTTDTIRTSARATLTAVLMLTWAPPPASANETDLSRPWMVAQGSGFERLPPSIAPTPYSPNPPPSSPSATGADAESGSNPTSRDRSPSSADLSWGSIAFTADGSYSSTWRMASQPEAEANVLRQCARFGRGGCEVVSFSGQQCVSLASFNGPYRRRRWSLSFTAGGMTYPEAQNAAMSRCNSDERTQGRCQPRTTACADGR